jgi:site-specific recombinase XerD
MDGQLELIQLSTTPMDEALLDFVLSRQAMLCSKRTMEWYASILKNVIVQLKTYGVYDPKDLGAKHVRMILAWAAGKGYADSHVHMYARVMKTFIHFMVEEEIIQKPITFKMPSIAEKRLPVLSAEDVEKAIKHCGNPRDKAIFLTMVDSGLRRAELCALDWGDVDVTSGLVRVAKGKGGKARSVVVGAATRRALLTYKRSITFINDKQPLFQTIHGNRILTSGLRQILTRIGEASDLHITPHSLRRTFATLSLRAGMNLIHLQGLMGHSTIEMTRQYIKLMDEDLVEAHHEHGPIDALIKR